VIKFPPTPQRQIGIKILLPGFSTLCWKMI
jgi:hypothetical protein